MKGALWITSQINSAISSIKSPTDNQEITFKIDNIQTKIKPTFKNNRVAFQIKSKGNAYLFSSNSNLDVKNNEMIILLQKSLNKDLANLMQQTFQTTKQAKCDAFRLSDYLDWRYPKAWEQLQHHWNEYYAEQLKIDIDVDIALNLSGNYYRSSERYKKN
ncbi:Ger(x)C family spore germination C-terminal domain-containing protein [Paenibacillus sp. D2_2]|uniref:Ger(x)C family spore germination C-terminal domain-containing protein n=1 Tax=Paenibacillus sp. D2_2 TaxID=3073092 RepID=UPI0028159735|nr:Ger(x)C family spore germination C-terminal domain-containing protein [Paenibacillus sp. D2_2]WMT43493.1 Ger(x)C family spore germination C-terminal domain-containing protein [Paenibacillus sp. D2_2]